MPPDHYAALGVGPDADTATIRAAYLALMRAHHPDRRPGDTAAIARVLEANAAWEVLRDGPRRERYDRQRRPRSSPVPHGSAGAGVDRPAPPRPPLQSPPRPPHSPERERYRRQFSGALLRVALVILAIGTVLLLAIPQR